MSERPAKPVPIVLPPIPAKRYFTIGEVSDLCGVKPHVLRYWEQEFTQLKPVKRRGNRRYYQHHEVLLIRRIRELLYEQGFTISGARNQLTDAAASHALPSLAADEPFDPDELEDEAPADTAETAPMPLATPARSAAWASSPPRPRRHMPPPACPSARPASAPRRCRRAVQPSTARLRRNKACSPRPTRSAPNCSRSARCWSADNFLHAVLGEPHSAGYNSRLSRGVAQPGSALAWGARGREFESRRPDQK